MTERPNIVLCTADQLRPFELAAYGGNFLQTPGLDRLAERGTVWQTAVSNYPVCLPARSILMSGQHNRTATGGCANIMYQGRNGDVPMPEYPFDGRPHLQERTLPECLRDRGYDNFAIGKWHIHAWPDDIGFDHYVIPRVHHTHTGQLYTRDGGPEFSPPGYSLDFEVAEAQRLFDARRGEARPFFLYLNLSPPHCPVADMPEEFIRLYDPDDVPIRPNVDMTGIDWEYWSRVYRWDYKYYSLRLPYTRRLPPGYSIRHLMAEYLGVVTWLDRALGEVVAGLEVAGLMDNTLFVFTSDHGDNLGSHGLVQKGTMNEESIRIPFVAAGPGVSQGRRVDEGVLSLVDLMPTLLEYAGAGVPAHCQGRSACPELCGAPGSSDRMAFVETRDGCGLRTARHTVFHERGEDGSLSEIATMLFDNRADPYQLDNLSERTTLPDLDAILRRCDTDIPWSDLGDDPE